MTEPTQPSRPGTPDALDGDVTLTNAPPPATWHFDAAPPPIPPRRSGIANAAGVVLIVLGVLTAIAAIAAFALTGMAEDAFGAGGAELPGGMEWTDAIGQALAIVAAILLVLAVGYVLSGVGVLRGSQAGRWGGIVLGVLGGLLSLPGALNMTEASGGGGILNILLLAAHIFVVVALAIRWHGTDPRSRPNLPA